MNYNYSNIEGKELPDLDEYASMFLPSIIEDDTCKINNLGCISGDIEDYFAVLMKNGKFRLMPGPEFGPRLYRGQNFYYPNCNAAIYRNKHYPKYVLSKIKLFEFIKLICSGPVVRLMDNFKILKHAFSMDFEGLAQHYELDTEMLDFTRSKDIAMFFALCAKNEKTNRYEPILDETKEAVIYTLDIKKMIDNGEIVNIIGMQPLLRPYKQKAFSISLKINDNLNFKPYITCTRIKVDKDESTKYYEMFDGGKALFPSEVVSDKAYDIKKSKVIDKEVVDFMFRRKIFSEGINNEMDLMRLLNGEDIEIIDKTAELLFSQDETELIINNWGEIKKDFMRKIKMRLVSDPK